MLWGWDSSPEQGAVKKPVRQNPRCKDEGTHSLDLPTAVTVLHQCATQQRGRSPRIHRKPWRVS